MSRLHKDFDHALARMGTYLHGQTSHDKYSNVKAYMYKEARSLTKNPESFDLRVKRDVGRFDHKSFVGAAKEMFPEQILKYGDSFGPSYSTHMWRIEVSVPKTWLTAESHVHLVWDSMCEASLFCQKTGKYL
jgi:hypothetical protein